MGPATVSGQPLDLAAPAAELVLGGHPGLHHIRGARYLPSRVRGLPVCRLVCILLVVRWHLRNTHGFGLGQGGTSSSHGDTEGPPEEGHHYRLYDHGRHRPHLRQLPDLYPFPSDGRWSLESRASFALGRWHVGRQGLCMLSRPFPTVWM